MIFDLSDQHCANLHLQNVPEMLCVQNGVFTAVAAENGVRFECDGTNGVQLAFDKNVVLFLSVVKINIAVIMRNAKTENKANTARIPRSERFVFKKVCNGINASFDIKSCRFFDGVSRKKGIARRDQRIFIGGKRSFSVLDLAREAIVKATEGIAVEFVQINAVFANEAADQRL